MTSKPLCEIRCAYCDQWSRSQIALGDEKSFFGTAMRENMHQCPFCNKMTPCNKENMRFGVRDDNGRVFYTEGKDTIY